jgi:hypothetical protein
VATNLQEFSLDALSPEFIEVYSTKNFAHIIKEWVVNTNKNLFLILPELAKASKGKIGEKPDQIIIRLLSENVNGLSQKIQNEWKLRVSLLGGISENELDFLTFKYDNQSVFETLCIYDWIHDFSFGEFPLECDESVIHLLFKVSQRETFCDCQVVLNSTIDRVRVSERMLTVRLETPRIFEGPDSYLKIWSRLLGLFNDPFVQQRWNGIWKDLT